MALEASTEKHRIVSKLSIMERDISFPEVRILASLFLSAYFIHTMADTHFFSTYLNNDITNSDTFAKLWDSTSPDTTHKILLLESMNRVANELVFTTKLAFTPIEKFRSNSNDNNERSTAFYRLVNDFINSVRYMRRRILEEALKKWSKCGSNVTVQDLRKSLKREHKLLDDALESLTFDIEFISQTTISKIISQTTISKVAKI